MIYIILLHRSYTLLVCGVVFYRCGNIAAVLEFKDVDNRESKLFKAVPDDQRVIPARTTTPYFL